MSLYIDYIFNSAHGSVIYTSGSVNDVSKSARTSATSPVYPTAAGIHNAVLSPQMSKSGSVAEQVVLKPMCM
jgi:hypothetical protein